MKMVIFVKQPQERGTVSCFLSPLPRQLFALITKNLPFLIWESKNAEREESCPRVA